mmetsp:Transcript_3090/g.18988  ORF Transcript_3090/g.18988 Transcript_3090/m.18988 type:complete len:526 (-) Transcript_3090:7761-9338(-)
MQDLKLVFVAAYKSVLNLEYVPKLLEKVKKEFCSRYSLGKSMDDFNPVFMRILSLLETTRQGGKATAQGIERKSIKGKGKEVDPHSASEVRDGSSLATPREASDAQAPFDLSKLKQKKGKGATKQSQAPNHKDTAKVDPKKPKAQRKWTEAEPEEKLDFSSKKNDDTSRRFDSLSVADGLPAISRESSLSAMDLDDTVYETEGSDDGDADEEGTVKKSWLSSMLEGLQGKKVLSEEDLAPVLAKLKAKLLSKNVAEEIAEELCESTRASLIGERMQSFTLVSSVVKRSLEESITKILTPNKSIDVLRQVQLSAEQGSPYIIVFVGVNGVGKSTNLAKIAYWLLQHKQKVMIAACDTFRSGAVEQLRIHSSRLQIPLFERGYEKDPAVVAADAVKQAKHNNMDVLLIDTAGRMQDNEPLMRSLARLLSMNKPNLVLFVGEALVGNDAVDQLCKFNERLVDLSVEYGTKQVIDGIVLTKFDTIDDKMGAALSMVYTSQAPIVFVGCGQTYTDLKRLNVKHVVHALLA